MIQNDAASDLAQVEGSQLELWRRIDLLARKPRDALQIMSDKERFSTAAAILLFYCLVRFPVVLQKLAAQGKLDQIDASIIAFSVIGFIFGIILAIVFMFAVGLIFHVVLNVILTSGRKLKDAVIMPILSLAPQLLLVFELPSVFTHFREPETFTSILVLRVVLDVISVRTFYNGCRYLFNLNRSKSVWVTLIPGIPVGLLVLGLVVGMFM